MRLVNSCSRLQLPAQLGLRSSSLPSASPTLAQLSGLLFFFLCHSSQHPFSVKVSLFFAFSPTLPLPLSPFSLPSPFFSAPCLPAFLCLFLPLLCHPFFSSSHSHLLRALPGESGESLASGSSARARTRGTFRAPSACGQPAVSLPPAPARFAASQQWPHCCSGWQEAGPRSWRVGKKASRPDPPRPGRSLLRSRLHLEEVRFPGVPRAPLPS